MLDSLVGGMNLVVIPDLILSEALPLQNWLGRAMFFEGQCICEEFDAISVGTKTKTGIYHIVRTCHALHNIAGQVGMNTIRWYIYGQAQVTRLRNSW